MPGKRFRPPPRLLQHPREHAVRQQADVLGEHAEHEPVDEMRHDPRVVAALSQSLGKRGEGRCGLLGERLPRFAGPQALRVRERPLQLVARGRVRQVVQPELVHPADAVGPVGVDAKPQHVRDDQQRRVLQRQRILTKLREGGVQVGALPLVLPGEVVALPDVRPAVAARVLARAALEAVVLAGRVGLRWRRLVQQPAQVDEVLLRRRALLQLRRPPLGDELVWGHAVTHLADPLSSTTVAENTLAPIQQMSSRTPRLSITSANVSISSEDLMRGLSRAPILRYPYLPY